MIYSQDPFAAFQKNSLDVFAGLTHKSFAGFEKLVDLNMTAAKAVVAESMANLQALAGAKDAQAVLALHSASIQPLAEKSASYSRHLYDIASGTGAELGKAFESQATDAQKAFANLVDSAAKNAPAGSETAVAVMKSAVSAANNAFESVQKAVKQASDVAEANFNAVANTAADAAKNAAPRKR